MSKFGNDQVKPVDKGAVTIKKPAKLAHVVLRTGQVEKMRDWYAKVLGAEVTYQNLDGTPKLCFMAYDEEHHRIAFVEDPSRIEKDAKDSSLEHIAFTYADLSDLMETYERLRGLGLETFWPINHGPTLSLYYHDPDGNRIELQCDTMSMTDAMRYARSEEFSSNEIGVMFDPDELLRRFKAGEREQDLMRRPAMPEGKGPRDMVR